MSLKDTIEGARREAEGNGVKLPKREAESSGSGDADHKGFVRSSAAKARPVREAGSSVRVASKPKQKDAFGNKVETKEEKKERKRAEREERDLRNRAYDVILRSIPGYRRTEKIFWGILGAGMVLAVISLVCASVLGEVTDISTWQGALSTISLVLAYAFIIASFVYDLAKRRKYRKEAEARVRGLTDKRIGQLLEQAARGELKQEAEREAEAERKRQEKEARKARRAARK